METDEEYLKRQRKRKARILQKEHGVKYTTALRMVESEELVEKKGGTVMFKGDVVS